MGRPKKDTQADSQAAYKGSSKRKDCRGIVLQTGETQLENGRYRYRYYDDVGVAHEVTSWRLRPEDPTPDGRKPDKSLREKEKEIRKQLEDGLQAWTGKMKVSDLVAEYMKTQIERKAWAAQTRFNYECQYKTHIENSFLGRKAISKVASSDIEQFYFSIVDDGKANSIKVSSLGAVNRLLNSSFKMAVKRKMIPLNVVSGCY